AAILVPYPYAVDDHQTVNANVLVDKEAAALVADKDLTEASLQLLLEDLITDRPKLMEMSVAAGELKRPQAAEVVTQICLGERDPAELSEVEA
ncbi:MAG: hypothetical protein KAG66_11115, partial [Methylococcales bacterium]|nr:hypothetical protein [Methylococcales bacterium]